MQTAILAIFSVLLVACGSTRAAEPAPAEPLITLTLRAVDLATAAAELSAQSGRRIEVANGVAAALGPDIKLSHTPFSSALQTLADAYRVCYTVRPTLTLQSCAAEDASPKAFLGLIVAPREEGDAPGSGAPVILVLSNSVAARAGVRQNDRVVSFNGRPIQGGRELTEAVSKISPGTLVPLEVMRGDTLLSLNAQL